MTVETTRELVTALVEHPLPLDGTVTLAVGRSGGIGDCALVLGEPEYEIATVRLEHGGPLGVRIIESFSELADDDGVGVPSALRQ